MSGLEKRPIKAIKRGISGLAERRPVKIRKPLATMPPAPDPIDTSAFNDNQEHDSAVELDQLKTGFRERMKQEQERFQAATDGSYYFVVVLESGKQVDALLRHLGLDKGADLFVDGRALADRVGAELPSADIRWNTSSRLDPKLVRLARKPGS